MSGMQCQRDLLMSLLLIHSPHVTITSQKTILSSVASLLLNPRRIAETFIDWIICVKNYFLFEKSLNLTIGDISPKIEIGKRMEEYIFAHNKLFLWNYYRYVPEKQGT